MDEYAARFADENAKLRDEIMRLNETIGKLCLSIAYAADDIKDGDEENALATLNVALKSQGCETV
jgi:hypothetical protein